MQEDFTPPKDDEEFERRAKEVSTEGARAVRQALLSKREQAVAKLDQEIAFYNRILTDRGEQV